MTVVLIVFFCILLVSFITGIIITVYEEKKTNGIVVLEEHQVPAEIEKIKIEAQEDEDAVEVLNLEKTLIMKPVEVLNLEKTMFFDKPILLEDYEDEEII